MSRLASLFLLAALPLSADEIWLRAVTPERPPAPAPKGRKGKPAPPLAAATPSFRMGDSGIVELTRGARFPEPGTPVPASAIDRTLLRLGPGRPMPLTGAREESTVTRLEATYAGVGLATLTVQLQPTARTLDGPAFEAFLGQAGADAVAAERRKRKDTAKAGKDVVVATAKAFTTVRDPKLPAQGPDATEPLGLPVEWVLGGALPSRAGVPITATLLVAGEPVAGAGVRVLPSASGVAPVARTDEKGQVSITPAAEGPLLLAAAVVRPLPKAARKKGDAYKKADWETFTTTLRLDVLAPAPAPSVPARKAPARRGAKS